MAGDSDRDKDGFSGLADLASKVSEVDDIVWSDPASEPKPVPVTKVSPSATKTGLSVEGNRKVATSPPAVYTSTWSGKSYG